MKAAFVDTSYVIALELTNDQNHMAALQHWRQMDVALPRLITTSYVFDERVTFFNSFGFHAKAVQVGRNLLGSTSLQLVHVDEALFQEGWSYFQQHQDKSYSLTDCISFVTMQKHSVETSFTFDKHFVQAVFMKEP